MQPKTVFPNKERRRYVSFRITLFIHSSFWLSPPLFMTLLLVSQQPTVTRTPLCFRRCDTFSTLSHSHLLAVGTFALLATAGPLVVFLTRCSAAVASREDRRALEEEKERQRRKAELRNKKKKKRARQQ